MIDETEKPKIPSKHTRALLAQAKGEYFFSFKRPLLKVDLAGRVTLSFGTSFLPQPTEKNPVMNDEDLRIMGIRSLAKQIQSSFNKSLPCLELLVRMEIPRVLCLRHTIVS